MSSQELPSDHDAANDATQPVSHEETLDTIAATKADIENLIKLITMRKKLCDETENETRYMKEYVASFISMGDLHK